MEVVDTSIPDLVILRDEASILSGSTLFNVSEISNKERKKEGAACWNNNAKKASIKSGSDSSKK